MQPLAFFIFAEKYRCENGWSTTPRFISFPLRAFWSMIFWRKRPERKDEVHEFPVWNVHEAHGRSTAVGRNAPSRTQTIILQVIYWASYGHSKSGKSKSAVASPYQLYDNLIWSWSWGAREASQAPWCAAIILKAVDSPTTAIVQRPLIFPKRPSTTTIKHLLCAAVKRQRSTWQRYCDDLELHHSEHMHTHKTQVTC